MLSFDTRKQLWLSTWKPAVATRRQTSATSCLHFMHNPSMKKHKATIGENPPWSPTKVKKVHNPVRVARSAFFFPSNAARTITALTVMRRLPARLWTMFFFLFHARALGFGQVSQQWTCWMVTIKNPLNFSDTTLWLLEIMTYPCPFVAGWTMFHPFTCVSHVLPNSLALAVILCLVFGLCCCLFSPVWSVLQVPEMFWQVSSIKQLWMTDSASMLARLRFFWMLLLRSGPDRSSFSQLCLRLIRVPGGIRPTRPVCPRATRATPYRLHHGVAYARFGFAIKKSYACSKNLS